MVALLEVTIPIVLLAIQDTSCNHLPRIVSRTVQVDIMKIHQHIPAISVMLPVQCALITLLYRARHVTLVITFNLHRPQLRAPIRARLVINQILSI